MQRSSAPTST